MVDICLVYHCADLTALVGFSLAEQHVFVQFLLHVTQKVRRCVSRYVWASWGIGGACTGRQNSPGLALSQGVASPNQKSLLSTELGGLLFSFRTHVRAALRCVVLFRQASTHSNTVVQTRG